jgi:YHS domain-containing protein
MVTDLVCGSSIDENNAGASYNYKRQTYYFCGAPCKDEFTKAPVKFLKKRG